MFSLFSLLCTFSISQSRYNHWLYSYRFIIYTVKLVHCTAHVQSLIHTMVVYYTPSPTLLPLSKQTYRMQCVFNFNYFTKSSIHSYTYMQYAYKYECLINPEQYVVEPCQRIQDIFISDILYISIF